MSERIKLIVKVLAGVIGILVVLSIIAPRNDAKVVFKVPDGYIAIEELEEAGLNYVFWETQISILENQSCIFQTNVRNASFLVKCHGKYYVNWEKIESAMEKDAGAVAPLVP